MENIKFINCSKCNILGAVLLSFHVFLKSRGKLFEFREFLPCRWICSVYLCIEQLHYFFHKLAEWSQITIDFLLSKCFIIVYFSVLILAKIWTYRHFFDWCSDLVVILEMISTGGFNNNFTFSFKSKISTSFLLLREFSYV